MQGTSPISIGIPGDEEAPLILDMGASFGLPDENEHFDLMPSAYFKVKLSDESNNINDIKSSAHTTH